MTVLVSLSEFTIKRNKWFILYKGVLKGLKRGGFQGAAFLECTPRVLFGNRNGAPPHCDREDLPKVYLLGRAIFDYSLLYREGGITPSSSLRSRQRLSALQPAIRSSSILCQPATMLA